MPEPVTLAALGVAIGKLLLRWGDLNDTADALEDAKSGFGALRALTGSKAQDPIGTAITKILEQRLAGIRDPSRREDLQIAVENVAAVFTHLTDDDIRAAAQDPDGFPRYLTRGSGQAMLGDIEEARARGPARILLSHTEQDLTPFTAQLITAAAGVFAELAPRSTRFTAGALVRLLNQVDAALAGVTDLQQQITTARDTLLAAQQGVAEQVEALHPKVDQILQATGPPESPVEASRRATRRRHVVGQPITKWEPAAVGVHASITVHDETTLTPYLARSHDQRLRQVLEQGAASDRARLVLVVGTSCAGKTRSLYEAVQTVLPDWQITAPQSDSDLAQTLTAGVPARTVVWLDELQDRLTTTPPGITAAKAITELLDADVGPIVVAGTLWTTSLMRMRDRPDPDMAAVGAGAITTLIGRATVVGVPDTFTNTDLENADVDDSRLQLAIRTATHTDHPYGRKIIQVLAGGTQLLHRTHPPDGTHPPDEFSPGAKALLHAAGDLRRIGMPNPLPRWALDGAAPAYLNPPDDPTPLDQWLPAAFTETTDADNPRTRTYSRDHYRHGVPALTPHWTTGPDGEPVEAYDLHDYLTQDHLTRHRYTPTKPSLWTCLTTQALTPDVDGELADAANDRGLLTTAITLLRPHANVVDDMRAEGLGFSKWLVRNRLASLLADRGDHNALVELRARAEAGDACAKGVLADSAGRVGVDALGESHADAENGQRRAQDRLAALLVRRAEGGDGHALNQLRRRAETGRGYAQDQLAALLARRAGRGDVGALNELRSRANADDRSALDWLIRLLADRAELGDNGALTELHALTGLDNPDARGRLTRLLADRAGRGHDVALGVLRCCVLAGYGGRELLHVHRARSSGSHVLELDYNANPVYER